MILDELALDNKNTIRSLANDIGRYYVGRTTPALLDRILVKYYGEMVPIEMCAIVSVSSPGLLIVSPWDPKMTKEIEKAIHAANTGLHPQADSEIVKVYLPKHTKEDDLKTFTLIKARAEKAKIAIRQNRKKARDKTKGLIVHIKITTEQKIQEQTDSSICEIDKLLNNKKKQMRI